jgi:tetratricopeptide (TPR) repeat protein
MNFSRKACVLAGFLITFANLNGCAYLLPQSTALKKHSLQGLKEKVELTQVPFFSQDKYQCGPAALAMSLISAGIKVTPDLLVDQVYIPAKKGSLQIEMLAAARRHGLLAYELAPQITNVLLEIAAGSPVIVLENYSYGLGPIWHYSVAIGYDLNEGRIIRRSGKHEFESMPFAAFEYLWKSDGHWAMVALPLDKIPASATEDRYAKAIFALENIGQNKNAQIAYKTLLSKWPESLAGHLGVGNTAYKLHDLDGAEIAFSNAMKRHPESVAALNNLAHVLAEQGKLDLAVTIAENAINMGGPLEEFSRATLKEIRKKLNNP